MPFIKLFSIRLKIGNSIANNWSRAKFNILSSILDELDIPDFVQFYKNYRRIQNAALEKNYINQESIG